MGLGDVTCPIQAVVVVLVDSVVVGEFIQIKLRTEIMNLFHMPIIRVPGTLDPKSATVKASPDLCAGQVNILSADLLCLLLLVKQLFRLLIAALLHPALALLVIFGDPQSLPRWEYRDRIGRL